MLKKPDLHLAGLIVLFLISRVILHLCGVTFDIAPLDDHIQIFDTTLLTTRYFETLFYSHTQPPLFNAFIGAVLKTFPEHVSVIFQLLYSALGCIFMISIYQILLSLTQNKNTSALSALIFVIAPSTILYEHWLFYSYPVAVLITLCALTLIQFLSTEKTRTLHLFLWLCMGLVFLRNSFHPLWFFIWPAFLIIQKRHLIKPIFIACIVPVILIFGLCFKNHVYFDTFSNSSGMLGYQLSTVMLSEMSVDEQNSAIQNFGVRPSTFQEINHPKHLGELAYMNNFPSVDYQIPILDNYRKIHTDHPNLESKYHFVSDAFYMKDARTLIQNFPDKYLTAVGRAFFLYPFPGPTDVKFPNREILTQYENAFNFLFLPINRLNDENLYTTHLWGIPYFKQMKWDIWSGLCYGIVVLSYFATLIGTLFVIVQNKKRPPVQAALMFMLFNIVYFSVVSNLISSFSNNRYRFTMDAFYWILGTYLLFNFIQFWKKRKLSR